MATKTQSGQALIELLLITSLIVSILMISLSLADSAEEVQKTHRFQQMNKDKVKKRWMRT
jgi:competence protein ComGC